MARAAVFTKAGSAMELVGYPTPAPSGAEVRVRVVCCTLCRSDLHTHNGRRIEPTPTVLGHEVVGRIEAFGPEASRADASGAAASVGDRITWCVAAGCGSCFYCSNDLPQKCGSLFKYGHRKFEGGRPSGGLAESIALVPGTAWFRVPESIPDAVAASANCATATVAALFRHAGPIGGRTVLILGAGVLGVTACAMAAAGGARTILVAEPVEECRSRAMLFGATLTCRTDPAELAEVVRQATQDRGADVVFELAGTTSSVQSAMVRCRTGGIVILAGTVAPVGTIEFDPEQIVRRMLTIRGVHNYHPRDLAAALEFLAGPGRNRPWSSLVVAEHPLEDVERAFAEAHARPGVRVAVRPSEGLR